MAITYTRQLLSLKTKNSNDLQNAIVEVNWEKTGTNEDGLAGTVSGKTVFDMSTINHDNFTALDDLTEEMVLGWIENNSAYETMVNNLIEKEIADQINPETAISNSEFPWLN